MNIEDIACTIFSDSPKPPQSIQLNLPNKDSCKDINQEIFNMLLELFHYGMVKYYGNLGKVDLTLLNENDFLKIRKYFWSFGFEIFYKVYDLNNNLILSNKEYTSNTELFDKYLTLDTDISKYEISFDYYNN